MNSRIIVQRSSNCAIGVGLRPITRTALSPRPMPLTMRPPEMSLSVACADAETAGSRAARGGFLELRVRQSQTALLSRARYGYAHADPHPLGPVGQQRAQRIRLLPQ